MADTINSVAGVEALDGSARLLEIKRLYHLAFRDYGVRALWFMRPVDDVTPEAALAITAALRTNGTMSGRRLAEQIESLCRAHD